LFFDQGARAGRLEMHNVIRFPTVTTLLGLACALAACSSVDNFLAGDKIDYRSQSTKTSPLEVPPDLTQLARDSRYQPQGGSVSASSLQGAAPAEMTPAVAPQAVGSAHIERAGNERWLVTTLTPEQLWPKLREFWQERGFSIEFDNAQTGVMETDWAENRAKLPQDVIRNTLGRVLDSLYSTGERDKFRTRVERTPTGSEVYISHRGLEEVYVSAQNDQTMWTNRPSDPQLEAEFLSRLMVKLGAKEDDARRIVASAPEQPARARLLDGQGAALQVDESFDRAWRRVGLALDRTGFTVEDRDRSGGTYYVRYVDPKQAAKEQPGFFSRIFGLGRDKSESNLPDRYRINLKGQGDKTMVSVLDSQGSPANGEVGQRIASLLVEDLK
jgi:outer membrane protein assembly factor BamC